MPVSELFARLQPVAQLLAIFPIEKLFIRRKANTEEEPEFNPVLTQTSAPATKAPPAGDLPPLSSISLPTTEERLEYSGVSQISAAGKACLPCGSDHFSTVSGELSEAMRFARDGSVGNPEVLMRISHAEDELNVFEREDGAPEKVVSLPPKEKELMDQMLVASRHLRHRLGAIATVQDLEETAAEAQTVRREIRTKLFQLLVKSKSPAAALLDNSLEE